MSAGGDTRPENEARGGGGGGSRLTRWLLLLFTMLSVVGAPFEDEDETDPRADCSLISNSVAFLMILSCTSW